MSAKTKSPLSVRDTLAGRHLLVTGVTGFLGKVWLAMILEHASDVGRVSLLIRGKKGVSAWDRFLRIADRSPAFRPLRTKHGEHLHELLATKVDVLEGDVAEPLCGLDEATLADLAPRIDAVVHFAGLTDFEPDPLHAVNTNIRGGGNAADVAARTKTPRLLHVSTCFVAGNVSGEHREDLVRGVSPNGTKIDPSAELDELTRIAETFETKRERVDAASARAKELGWQNIYCLTKGISEQLLAERDDVALCSVRPSIVESSLSYPFPGWNEGINTSGPLVWLLSTWFRHLPAKDENHFDVIPVDTVARGTTLALAELMRGEHEEVYQLASGDTNPLLFERAIDLMALAARRKNQTDGSAMAKMFIKRLDAVPRGWDDEPWPTVGQLRKAASGLRDFLRKTKAKDVLPPKLYRDLGGEKLDDKLKSLSMECRNTDRTLGRIEEMLRLYRPFTHDNDYLFRTDHTRAASERLVEEERAVFRFDIDALDWRHYWVFVHVPGLDKWSLPLMRGDKAPEDDPPRRRRPSPLPPAPEHPVSVSSTNRAAFSDQP